MAGFQMSFDEAHRCLYYPDQVVGGERPKHPLLDSEEIDRDRRLGKALSPNEATLPGAKLSPAYVAYQFEGGRLAETTVKRLWDGQKFAPSATPWELQRSVLAAHVPSLGSPGLPIRPAGGSLFVPVVAPSPLFAQVVGHIGRVQGDDLIAPTKLAGGSVKDVFARGVLFVAEEEHALRPPDGWTRVGVTAHSHVVLTTPDGQVVNVLGTTDRGAAKELFTLEQLGDAVEGVAKWAYRHKWEIALSILLPEVLPWAVRLATRGRQTLRTLVGRLKGGPQVRGLLAGATPELAASELALVRGGSQAVRDFGGSGNLYGVISVRLGASPEVALARRQAGGLSHSELAREAWKGGITEGERRFGISGGLGQGPGVMVHKTSGTFSPTDADLPNIVTALRSAGLLDKAMVQVGQGPTGKWLQWQAGQWAPLKP